MITERINALLRNADLMSRENIDRATSRLPQVIGNALITEIPSEGIGAHIYLGKRFEQISLLVRLSSVDVPLPSGSRLRMFSEWSTAYFPHCSYGPAAFFEVDSIEELVNASFQFI